MYEVYHPKTLGSKWAGVNAKSLMDTLTVVTSRKVILSNEKIAVKSQQFYVFKQKTTTNKQTNAKAKQGIIRPKFV